MPPKTGFTKRPPQVVQPSGPTKVKGARLKGGIASPSPMGKFGYLKKKGLAPPNKQVATIQPRIGSSV